MDLTIKDIPTQAQVDRIKATALRIIEDMEKPKVTEAKQTEYETKVDAILVANSLPAKFTRAEEVEDITIEK